MVYGHATKASGVDPNKSYDFRRRAKVVAPAVAKTPEDLAKQKSWFDAPNKSDFEGVDTPRPDYVPPPPKVRVPRQRIRR